jgi:hypothetical protein
VCSAGLQQQAKEVMFIVAEYFAVEFLHGMLKTPAAERLPQRR